METDLVCPEAPNIDRDSQLTENTEAEKQDVEASQPHGPHGPHISSPADDAVKPDLEDLDHASEPNADPTQEWPPVPELPADLQADRDERQDEVQTNTHLSEDVLTSLQEHVNMTQIPRVEEICSVDLPLDSQDDSDSVEFPSEQKTDCQPADHSGFDVQSIQQKELEPRSHLNEVEQQVCADVPPLDTVTGEAANPEPDRLARPPTEDEEPFTMTEAMRDGEREEEEGGPGETGEERKQTGGAEEERQAEVKDQRQGENKAAGETESRPITKAEGKGGKMDLADRVDDSQSDSGVSADFSPNSTMDASDCPVNPNESLPNETPIEREIRLAVMREQNLRRDRGLDDVQDKTKEFVEIPVRKPILSQDAKPNPSLGKDSQFAGRKMLMEINAEAEREKVLVELGQLPGLYDKGMEVQVQEKKLLFESFQDQNAAPCTNGEQAAGRQDFDFSVDVKQRLVQFSQHSPNPGPEGLKSDTPGVGPALTETTMTQVIIIETTPAFTSVPDSNTAQGTSSKTEGASTAAEKPASMRSSSAGPVGTTQTQSLKTTEDKDDRDTDLVKENPFFKLRTSVSLLPQVEQDIKEAKERERELQMQRNSLYGESEQEAERKTVEIKRTTETDSGMIDRERSERRPEDKPTSSSEEIPNTSAKQTNLIPTSFQTETSITPTSVRQSTGKLELTWPPPQSDEEKQQSEKASRTPRQRTPLLDRWESGMVNGHVEDNN